MNVGISIFTTPGASIWSSGLNQNLAFLVLLLRQCPKVGGIFLINGGDGDKLPDGMSEVLGNVPLVRPEDITHRVDVVIEMGAQLPQEWMRRVRALGVKLVLFVVGHTFAGAAENPMFGLTGGLTFTGIPWDEVWILPQHAHSSASLLRTVARAPVHVLPHLWSPVFLQASIDRSGGAGPAFGFCPSAGGQTNWRVGIFEPNISVVKNCVVSMMACEQAYRSDPESIELMMVMNSLHMKEHASFNSLAANFDLARDHKASFEPRIGFADCMASHRLNAVVSHHWECGLNYLYYDALYGGYPLVHNSEFLQRDGVGFYYPGFEAFAAARELLKARSLRSDFWQDYRKSAHAFLARLSPEQPVNIHAFLERLTG